MNKVDLSIIMVNWKVADLILKNLASIFKYSENFSYEVIVVDNNSGDNIEVLLKENFSEELDSGKLVFIQSGANLGFAKGNNLGLWVSLGEHVVFMNPDMELFENTYWKMLNYYKRPYFFTTELMRQVLIVETIRYFLIELAHENDKVILLKHEALCENIMEEVKSIYYFLGLEHDDEVYSNIKEISNYKEKEISYYATDRNSKDELTKPYKFLTRKMRKKITRFISS